MTLATDLLVDSGVGITTVTAAEDGMRCDKFLAIQYAQLHSRAYFHHLILRGCVFVNGKQLQKKSLALSNEAVVEVHFAALPPPDLIPEALPLDIVYEDDEIIVMDKAAGMVVHPAPGHSHGTLVNALLHHCSHLPLWQVVPGQVEVRPGIVHRLDKDTSGLIVAAKTARSHRLLVEAFASRQVNKRYLAVCLGNPGIRTVEANIGRHARERHKMAVVTDGGKSARTVLTSLHTNKGISAVLAAPHTGRTHQIRVHLQHVGTPILGDALYGSASCNQKLTAKRQLLHAWQLAFSHPVSGEKLSFCAPPPADFQAILMRHLLPYEKLIINIQVNNQ
jgi:23S rRNA pseudouridine1911/1915/1917 synthase